VPVRDARRFRAETVALMVSPSTRETVSGRYILLRGATCYEFNTAMKTSVRMRIFFAKRVLEGSPFILEEQCKSRTARIISCMRLQETNVLEARFVASLRIADN
jgi:hypothetical protein